MNELKAVMAGLIHDLAGVTRIASSKQDLNEPGARELRGSIKALIQRGEQITIDLDNVFNLTEAEAAPLVEAMDRAFDQVTRLEQGKPPTAAEEELAERVTAMVYQGVYKAPLPPLRFTDSTGAVWSWETVLPKSLLAWAQDWRHGVLKWKASEVTAHDWLRWLARDRGLCVVMGHGGVLSFARATEEERKMILTGRASV